MRDKVDYVAASAGDRFELLGSGEIDVLIRTTTFTFSRDVDLESTFQATTFYDGQAMMVKADSAFNSLDDMDGATICVTSGTTTEQNLDDAFEERGISYTPLAVEGDGREPGELPGRPLRRLDRRPLQHRRSAFGLPGGRRRPRSAAHPARGDVEGAAGPRHPRRR